MRYIGDWQTEAPTEPGPWQYVEAGSHSMNICMVMTRGELLTHRARAIINGFILGFIGVPIAEADWARVNVTSTELSLIAAELDEADEGNLDELTTNRSSDAKGAPPRDDLAPVTELNRWWCNAAVEPENGPPGFDEADGAHDPSRYAGGR